MTDDRGFGAPVLLVTLALVGAFCMAMADVANVLVSAQRAQAAADAAALAAVAAQWPATGSGDDPGDAARVGAEANGATLQRCACEPRGDGVEVDVSVRTSIRVLRVAPDSVHATASARVDRGRLFQPVRSIEASRRYGAGVSSTPLTDAWWAITVRERQSGT